MVIKLRVLHIHYTKITYWRNYRMSCRRWYWTRPVRSDPQ